MTIGFNDTLKSRLSSKNITLYLDDVIALCYILDGFEEFNKNLKNFVTNSSTNELYILGNIARGIKVLRTFKSKWIYGFYLENKIMIDLVNKFSNIKSFVQRNYIDSSDDVWVIYEYILKNRANLSKMLLVLNKLKELGFSKIVFNESMSFDNQVYHYALDYPNLNFFYSNGDLCVYPNYDANDLKYSFTNSNYLMDIAMSFNNISKGGHAITLNSLIFDVNDLPNELTLDETINKAKEQKKVNENIDKFISNAVSLDYLLSETDSVVKRLGTIIENLSEVEDKEKGIQLVSRVKDSVNDISEFLQIFEEKKLKENDISKELLEQEKSLYKKNRETSTIH